MYPINLPKANIKIREENEQTYIFDVIRKKYLVLTPEEWVRQHVVHLLINSYNYPKGLFRTEMGHTYNQLQKRTDVLIYNASGEVDVLVECKAPEVTITQQTITQAMQYNLVHKASTVIITNGLQTFCFVLQNGKWVQENDFPSFKK